MASVAAMASATAASRRHREQQQQRSGELARARSEMKDSSPSRTSHADSHAPNQSHSSHSHGGGGMPPSSSAPSSPPSPSVKSCSVCVRDLEASAFSSSQLKKKGKRVCKSCVDRQQVSLAQQREADLKEVRAKAAARAAAAVKATSKASTPVTPAIVVTTAPPIALATAIVAPCMSCGKTGKRTCSKCSSSICDQRCLRAHLSGLACQAARTRPTETLDAADVLTDEDLLVHLPDMVSEVGRIARALLVASPAARSHLVHIGKMDATTLASARTLYPPSISCAWWVRESNGSASPAQEQVHILLVQLIRFIEAVNSVYTQLAAVRHGVTFADLVVRGCIGTTFDGRTIWQHRSRLWHKLLTTLAYVVRTCNDINGQKIRAYAKLDSEEYGLIPVSEVNVESEFAIAFLGWVTVTDEYGAPLKVPLALQQPVQVSSLRSTAESLSMSIGFSHVDGRALALMTDARGDIVQDACLHINLSDPWMFASPFTGDTGDRRTAFTLGPHKLAHASLWIMYYEGLHQRKFDERTRLALEAVLSSTDFRIGHSIYAAVINQRRTVHPTDEWIMFLPRAGVEAACADFAILQSLAELAEEGDLRARALVESVEETSGRTITKFLLTMFHSIERAWIFLKIKSVTAEDSDSAHSTPTDEKTTESKAGEGATSASHEEKTSTESPAHSNPTVDLTSESVFFRSSPLLAPTPKWMLDCATGKQVIEHATCRFRLFIDLALYLLHSDHVDIHVKGGRRVVTFGGTTIRLVETPTSATASSETDVDSTAPPPLLAPSRISLALVELIDDSLVAARNIDPDAVLRDFEATKRQRRRKFPDEEEEEDEDHSTEAEEEEEEEEEVPFEYTDVPPEVPIASIVDRLAPDSFEERKEADEDDQKSSMKKRHSDLEAGMLARPSQVL